MSLKIAFFALLLAMSCREPSKAPPVSSSKDLLISDYLEEDTSKIIFGKPLLKYDKVDYYCLDERNDNIYNLLENKSKVDTIRHNIIRNSYPENDTIYELKNLKFYEFYCHF